MKIRTDFVTNSSSSSFITVVAGDKNGGDYSGSFSASTDYYTIELISSLQKSDPTDIENAINISRDGFEFCHRLTDDLVSNYHTVIDRLDEIRQIDNMSDLSYIAISADQDGSSTYSVDYIYDFEEKKSFWKTKYNSDETVHTPLINKYVTKGDSWKKDGFVVKDGVLINYSGTNPIITLPKGIMGIGVNAFCYCDTLEGVIVPEGVLFIDNGAFLSCKKLRNAALPKSLERLGFAVFHSCDKLKRVWLFDNLKEMGQECFCGCGSLYRIELPDSLRVIPKMAFGECKALEFLKLPKRLNKIEENAFYHCDKLNEITIPEGIKELRPYSFASCQGLKRVFLPKTVEKFTLNAFAYCDKIPELVFAQDNPFFETENGCIYSVKDKRLIRFCPSEGEEKSCVIRDGTVAVGEYAFSGCEELRSVALPSSLRLICHQAFYGCKFLSEINPPQSLRCIMNEAFEGCSALTRIEVYEGTVISENAFDYDTEIIIK